MRCNKRLWYSDLSTCFFPPVQIAFAVHGSSALAFRKLVTSLFDASHDEGSQLQKGRPISVVTSYRMSDELTLNPVKSGQT